MPLVVRVADQVQVAVAAADVELGLPVGGVAHAQAAHDGSRSARVGLDVPEARLLVAEQGRGRLGEHRVVHPQLTAELVPEVVRGLVVEACGHHGALVVVRGVVAPIKCRIVGLHSVCPSYARR